MRDYWSDAALPCGVPIGLAGVAFVADDSARLNVGPDVEQGFEATPVEGFAAGQWGGTKRGRKPLKTLGGAGKIAARPKRASPARHSPSVGTFRN